MTGGRALSLRHLPQLALWGFLFLLWIYLPLRSMDLWVHVANGDWILEQGSLPSEDPLMPLAEGMPVLDTTWLSQVALAAAERAGGAEWLSALFALTVLLTYLLLARTFQLQSGSGLVATLGALGALALSWSRSTNFGPETFGALCFATLLWLLTSAPGDGPSRADPLAGKPAPSAWVGIPLLLALWANLHGSFVYGLAVLACCFAGQAIDSVRRTRGPRRALDDPSVRRALYLLELGAAATLLNPYGLDLPLHALGLAPRGLADASQPLVVSGPPGVTFAVSAVVLMFVFRHSRRSIPAAHVLLLAFFAAAAASGVGRLAWYGPVFGLIVVPHIEELRSRFAASRRKPARPPASDEAPLFTTGPDWHYTVIGVTIAAIIFVLSPLSSSLLGRAPRTSGQILGSETPLALTAYLTASPPRGQVFNPVHWGGWLALEGPPDLELFATTDLSVTPRRVLLDYQRVVSAAAEWVQIMDRYRIDTVIVDRAQLETLDRLMRSATDWTPVYQDPLSAVYVRVPDDHDHAESSPSANSSSGSREEVTG